MNDKQKIAALLVALYAIKGEVDRDAPPSTVFIKAKIRQAFLSVGESDG